MNRYQKVHSIIYYKKLSKVIMYKYFNPFFKCTLSLTSEHIGFLMFSEKGRMDNKWVNNLMATCASVYTVFKKFYEFYGRGCQRVGGMCSGIQFFLLKLYFFLFQNPKYWFWKWNNLLKIVENSLRCLELLDIGIMRHQPKYDL